MARRKQARHAALALLEFESVAAGVRTTDLMVKGSPIALLRCGTIHPGRYLALVGGSVASTEAAYRIGVEEGENDRSLRDAVLLADIHPVVHDAVLGARRDLVGDALLVVETTASPALLAAVDAALKRIPVVLGELRLADDLGGRALTFLSGALTDVDEARGICIERAGNHLLSAALLPRLDANLRTLLDHGSQFRTGAPFEPAGAEHPEEAVCSWDE
jgi:microcompartment protein CcmL/EutN